MNEIESQYLLYSLITLFIACLLASVYTSLRFTGDGGVPRLIAREDRHVKRLAFWQSRWPLLGKTVRLLLILSSVTTFILFYRGMRDCADGFIILGIFLLSLVYMLIARIIPHVLSESYADRISLAALPVAGTLTLLMYPFVWPLQKIEDRLLHHAMSASDQDDRPSAEDEIKSLIDETDEEYLEEEEREIIRSVFEFGDTVTREIMTPRIDISGLKDTLTVGQCIDEVKESRHSRFPVYHESIDDIVGMVHVKDLLRFGGSGQDETPIVQLLKRIDFVPETMPINDLMKQMKQMHSQIAIVVDEYGGTEGLVSMEDIIEELVGEIEDEYDPGRKELFRRPDGSFMVQARMPIIDLNEELGIKLPEGEEYDSLGGYISSMLGRIPTAGETLEAAGCTLCIHSATNRQIELVQLIPVTPAS